MKPLPDQTMAVADAPRAERTFCPPDARPYVLVSAVLASSMGFIDGSVVSLALPAMRADLGASLADAQWFGNAYMLLLSALVLIGGAAGDVFGVRTIFGCGIAVFIVTSLACAIAPDANTLIVMRALQGLGAAFMVPGSLALIAKSYPARERGRAIGIWAAASSATTALGPFLGGMVLSFGDAWTWRIIFAINVPIGIAALALLFLRVPQDRPQDRRRLDLPGALLATVSLGLIAWGLTAFGVADADRVVPPTAWLVLGMATFAALIWWESRAPSPMIKLDLFRSRAFSGANLYTLVLFFAFSGVLFFLPMTLIAGWGVNELEVSLLMLPIGVLIALLSGPAGRFADRRGPRLPLTIGAALVGAGYLGIAATMPLMQIWTVTLPAFILGALGMAILVSPLSTAVMLATSDEDTGLASGINNAVARAAGLIAVAALGALAGVAFRNAMPESDIEFGARPGAGIAVDPALVAATNHAFAVIAYLCAALCLAAALLAWRTQPAWVRPPEGDDGRGSAGSL